MRLLMAMIASTMMEWVLKDVLLSCSTLAFILFLWMFIRVPDWGSYGRIRNAAMLLFVLLFFVGEFCIVRFVSPRPVELQTPIMQPPLPVPARNMRIKGVFILHASLPGETMSAETA
jgi:hypothetical protein